MVKAHTKGVYFSQTSVWPSAREEQHMSLERVRGKGQVPHKGQVTAADEGSGSDPDKNRPLRQKQQHDKQTPEHTEQYNTYNTAHDIT